jgi:predicted HTH transcriptional regulator
MDEIEKKALAIRLRTFLDFPGEDGEVDYKASFTFSEKDPLTFKLAKHIIGMANAGGGYVVIGVKQDAGAFCLDEAHTPEAQGSFDTTRLSQFIRSVV